MSEAPDLGDLLVQHHAWLAALLRREGAGLLPYESEEDLAQGVHERALSQEGFVFQGEPEFQAWLRVLAKRYVADRHRYWSALRRGAGKVLRLTVSDRSTVDPRVVREPAPTGGTPSTLAAGRERMHRTVRALEALPERDRELLRWRSEGVALADQAERLGIGYEAVQRASLRALTRLRKLLELGSQGA